MLYLSLEAQHSFQVAQHVIFGVASILNLVSLLCMIKEIPPHQAKIRKYATIIVNSVYMDILLQPIPLFPALGGICLGLLCQAGILPHIVFAGLIITFIFFAAATFFCFYFRHQTLLPEGAQLDKIKSRALIAVVICVPTSATVTYAAIPFNPAITDDLAWARERGPLFIHERSTIVMFFMGAVTVMLGGCILIFLTLFLRMYYALYYNKKRSTLTIRKIRKSLIILFIQIFIPFLMLIGPAIIILGGMVCECIPFEANLALFSMMICHPVTHNIIILLTSPTYRAYIMSFIFHKRNRSIAAEHQTTVASALRRQKAFSIVL